jgi:tripartite-type tricarboxylate transporter receptor subunit TctC
MQASALERPRTMTASHPLLPAGHLPRRTAGLALAAVALTLATAPWAHAQSAWPSKPITLVIPFPPGGSADTIGRLMGKRLADALGQAVVIDNRPGAGTAIAAGYVAKAPADGYTLLISSGSTFTANPAIRSNLPYDPLKSFDPVAIVARIPLIVLANKAVPVNNVKEFVAAIKAAPEKYSYASFGSGTTSHFTAEIVLGAVGAQLLHVPYKGSGPAMTDLIGGQVPFSVDTVTAAIPQLKAGTVKAIGVTTTKRSSQLPNVPTFAEAGYPQVNADTWLMLVAPKGTPPAVRQQLEQAVAKIVATPDAKAALQAQGAEPAFADGVASVAQIERELPLMRAVAQRANIQAD